MPSLKRFVDGAVQQLQKRLLLDAPLRKALKKKKTVFDENKYSMFNDLWNKILDYSSPYDMLRWRRVSKHMQELIDERLKKILYLQVFRMNLSLVLGKNETDDGNFYRHNKAQILLEIASCNATLVVQDRWTARDVVRLFAGIRQLGANARTVTMSASVAELLTAGQSTLGLERWYSFQCYLKALDNYMDVCSAHVQGVQTKTDAILFPKLRELTIRVAVNEVSALVRLKDYCTNLDALCLLDSLHMFRICLIGQQPQERDEELLQMKRRAKQLLKTFKQWLDCASLKERYCQQYI